MLICFPASCDAHLCNLTLQSITFRALHGHHGYNHRDHSLPSLLVTFVHWMLQLWQKPNVGPTVMLCYRNRNCVNNQFLCRNWNWTSVSLQSTCHSFWDASSCSVTIFKVCASCMLLHYDTFSKCFVWNVFAYNTLRFFIYQKIAKWDHYMMLFYHTQI